MRLSTNEETNMNFAKKSLAIAFAMAAPLANQTFAQDGQRIEELQIPRSYCARCLAPTSTKMGS
jgi:hypothetical protein